MAYIVALTGGIGSGKSTVAKVFLKFGVSVIDSDHIARKVVEPGTSSLCSIIDRFGTAMINDNGTLNRRLLRERIFSSNNEKDWLHALLHPIIYKETQRQIAQVLSPYVLWIVPLLVESQLHKKADRILVIDVAPETQIKRTMIRDKVSYEQIKQILSAQDTRSSRLTIADDIINNDGEPNTLTMRIAHLHTQYTISKSSKFHNLFKIICYFLCISCIKF